MQTQKNKFCFLTGLYHRGPLPAAPHHGDHTNVGTVGGCESFTRPAIINFAKKVVEKFFLQIFFLKHLGNMAACIR